MPPKGVTPEEEQKYWEEIGSGFAALDIMDEAETTDALAVTTEEPLQIVLPNDPATHEALMGLIREMLEEEFGQARMSDDEDDWETIPSDEEEREEDPGPAPTTLEVVDPSMVTNTSAPDTDIHAVTIDEQPTTTLEVVETEVVTNTTTTTLEVVDPMVTNAMTTTGEVVGDNVGEASAGNGGVPLPARIPPPPGLYYTAYTEEEWAVERQRRHWEREGRIHAVALKQAALADVYYEMRQQGYWTDDIMNAPRRTLDPAALRYRNRAERLKHTIRKMKREWLLD
ncbi:hypothetical protein ABW19_dt0205063 [Dactylella cylindrospora]|nr:hypothetical protein ABW19_dt0205063 [Dactylella cylindrospora]